MNDIIANIKQFEVSDNDFEHRSTLHGRMHTHRVMAWVFVLAQKMNMNGPGKLAFFAARVHDLGRLTDGREPGHGLLSADKYLPRYRKLFSEFGLDEASYNVVYNAVKWHSKSDEPPISTDNMEVINLLKDADGLDRVRLGWDEPDERFLRNSFTKTLIPAARSLYEISEEKKTMALKEIVQLAFELSE